MKILLVETDPVTAQIVADKLRAAWDAKHAVLWAGSVADGIFAASRGNIDIVLAPAHLMDSQEGPALLTYFHGTREIPVIVLTEPGNPRVSALAAQGLVEDWVLGGEDVGAQLAHVIPRALERRCLLRELAEKNQELADIVRNFHNLMAALADGVLIVDDRQRVRYANPPAQDILDFAFDALQDIPFKVPVVVGEVTEVPISRHSHSPRAVEFRAARFTWEGKPAMLVTLRDVTPRRTGSRQEPGS